MQSLSRINNTTLASIGPVGSTGLGIAVALGLTTIVRYAVQGGIWAVRKIRNTTLKTPVRVKVKNEARKRSHSKA